MKIIGAWLKMNSGGLFVAVQRCRQKIIIIIMAGIIFMEAAESNGGYNVQK